MPIGSQKFGRTLRRNGNTHSRTWEWAESPRPRTSVLATPRAIELTKKMSSLVLISKQDCRCGPIAILLRGCSITAIHLATPIITDPYVITLGAFGDLHCLDIETGKVIWKKHFAKGFWRQASYLGDTGFTDRR